MCRSLIWAWYRNGFEDRSFPNSVYVHTMAVSHPGTATPTISDALQHGTSPDALTCTSDYIGTYVCQLSHPANVHQPYAMVLSRSATGVLSVALSVKPRASLQKHVNISCQARTRQNMIASISMLIGEECMILWKKLEVCFKFEWDEIEMLLCVC
jgi:hypothetical protein